ncbi:S-adenosylmethionine decarboxylase proenzyme [Synechococcus phage S-CRM01]|uniref:S-adenosylmethionine decarboxylase n=1 Tax=Synechococcus phage S-CRM01 TaxID=1026955 RepID=UPI000209E422|nr:S-adenosylmethionine decarboxylase [Synechococcus phage S-CRM01]AEC53155.1 S-adenosylmethionine decarboxylase proenzyme [Synechococcus phage S-CRM01]
MENVILGVHALTRIDGASFDQLNNFGKLHKTFIDTVKLYELSSISEPLIHQFHPYGLTGIILLAESHISIHTWPELGKATLDVFTCGQRSSEDIANYFASCLTDEENFDTQIVYR